MIQVDREFVPDNFYVAVSGGVDSIAAAHLLQRLGYVVGIAHYNHNLREQNNLMQESVRQFAEDLGVVFKTEIREAVPITGSEEAVLRTSRLDFFKRLESNIVLCQHLDDAVESYVMNMLRGNPEHMPIPEYTPLVYSQLFRPFLKTRKQDFIDYANNNDLMKYVVEDETNKDNKYRRNWIRNEVLPQFKMYGLPKIVLKKFYL
jgi:tRNA(Ile)-lysidine synthase